MTGSGSGTEVLDAPKASAASVCGRQGRCLGPARTRRSTQRSRHLSPNSQHFGHQRVRATTMLPQTRGPARRQGLYIYGLYSYGPYSYDLYSYGLYNHGPYSYGLCTYGLYSYGLYSYGSVTRGPARRQGLYSYGLYSYGLYNHGLYNHGLYNHGLYNHGLYKLWPIYIMAVWGYLDLTAMKSQTKRR